MFKPTEEQEAVAEAVKEGSDVKVIAGPGTGKAQPLDEPILTPTGFKELKDIHKGDSIIGSRGTPIKVSNIILHDSLNMYELTFSDGTTTRSCEDHLWEVYDVNKHVLVRNKTPKVLSLKNMLHRINNPRIKKRSDGSARIRLYEYAVKLVQPIEFATKEYKIPPYLMGYILGNGSSAKQKN